MTLDEKISLLSGKNLWETVEIERLGIPSLKVTDGPNGARGADFLDGTTAACFPACVSLASTFDLDLARRVGKALGEETQTKGSYVLLGPTVCGHRSPVGGRNFEAFSEDPLLTGLMASEYTKGLQSERVAATVKHFLANEQETRRFTVDQVISERALREIYLKSFEIVVKEADPWCIMTCYPKVNGLHIDQTPKFMTDILRTQWGYKGMTMTDWGAASTVESVRNGLDLEMPGPPRQRTKEAVQQALKDGLVSEADIDARVLNSLELLQKVGKFTDRKSTPAEQAVDKPEHRALIREAGAAGLVLLKNRDRVLPVDTTVVKKIALLGPLAKHASAHGGGSASLNCHYKISPFDALSERLGDTVDLTYSKGTHIFRAYPDLVDGVRNRNGNPGYLVEYMENLEATGEPFKMDEVTRSYFTTHDQFDIKEQAKSARLTTTFHPKTSGTHYLSLSSAGHSKLYINDELIAEQAYNIPDAMAFIPGVQDEVQFRHTFDASRAYEIRIDTFMPTESVADIYILDWQLCAHLGFVSQAEMEVDLIGESQALARDADLAIVFTGNTQQWESEGHDLHAMVLPPYETRPQDALVRAVAAANPKTVVVNCTGTPVELPWLNEVAGFVQAWYAGQEAGNAIADVLLGDVNPSGKLPSSWPRLYEHTACYGNFGLDSHESRKVEYVEGVFVGYRHFDRKWDSEKEVLFPFGFGLSYTEFAISGASISGSLGPDDKVEINVHVENTGSRRGAETVQVYLAPPQDAVLQRPIKGLVGFAKLELSPGEKKIASVQFRRDAAAFWEEGLNKWKVSAGQYEVLVAASSNPRDVRARLALDVTEEATFDP
ncbi:hypothetical protein GQ53DRAFT_675543 [Thozetella sp. PMI_491]|nr:hypothetical protein GQ53DRAFT_675543 [Thozetella sp. PMI_491]